MKTRSLICHAWEIQAFLEGRKSQIRRPMKPQPIGSTLGWDFSVEAGEVWMFHGWPSLSFVLGDSSESPHTMSARFTLYPCCRMASYSSSTHHGTLWPSGRRDIPRRWILRPVSCSHTAEPSMCFQPFPGRRANRRTRRLSELPDCVSDVFMGCWPAVAALGR